MKLWWKTFIPLLIFLVLTLSYMGITLFNAQGVHPLQKSAPPAETNVSPSATTDTDHEKGYLWAQEQGISEVNNCPPKSKDFQKGCQAYVQDTVADDRQDQDSVEE